jgi:hypothetical protein
MAGHVAAGRLPGLVTLVAGILFAQRKATSPEPPPVVQDFWPGINAATASL